jgi:SRSO17 transposase
VISWREGSNRLPQRTIRGRAGAPCRWQFRQGAVAPEQWLLIEWPTDQDEPTKYCLSTLSETTPLNELVAAAHQRWRIERDYQDLKQDFGLGHYEGAAGAASITTPRCASRPTDS